VPLRDDEHVALRHRVLVGYRNTEFVLNYYSLRRYFAKYATRLSVLIRLDHFAEIRVVSVSLHRVARVAKRLKITGIIASAVIARNDMIDF
jgi:hypothetical protein